MPTTPHEIRKVFTATVTKGPARDTDVFTISTGSVDRDNDRLDPHTWNLDSFRANPVVLYGHSHADLPIAKCVDITVVNNTLKATIEWPPPGVYPFADTVKAMVKTGFLNATSVGFRSARSEPNPYGGRDYHGQELCEFSLVPIPSNPSALVERGLNRMQFKSWLGNSWREQHKEDDMDTEMYLEITDDFYSKAVEDDFEAMCARLRQGYQEMTGDKFIQLMAAQLIANPEAAAAVTRALQSAGVYGPKYFDIDEKQLTRAIGRVLAEEAGKQTRAALCQALGRLD